LGRILISNDKLDEAEIFIYEQLKKGIEDDKLSVLLAETYRQQGKIKEALQALNKTFASPTVDCQIAKRMKIYRNDAHRDLLI
jgi:predicted Zn-dependent protease